MDTDSPEPHQPANQGRDALADIRMAYLELAATGRDVFIALDERLRYFCWNHAAERLTGIPAWQALGQSFYQVFPEGRGGPAERLYTDVMRTHEPMMLLTRCGRERYEVTAYPFSGGVSMFARALAGPDTRTGTAAPAFAGVSRAPPPPSRGSPELHR